MLNIEEQKACRKAYQCFANCYYALQKYSLEPSLESIENLSAIAKNTNVLMPLPSGKWGNILAVALEMNLYPAALFLIENSDVLGIDLNSVVSLEKNDLNAYETFCLSRSLNPCEEIENKLESMYGFKSQR